MRYLVPFEQFEKREKHPCVPRVTFNKLKPSTLLKVTLLHKCFQVSQILQMVPNQAKHHNAILKLLKTQFLAEDDSYNQDSHLLSFHPHAQFYLFRELPP